MNKLFHLRGILSLLTILCFAQIHAQDISLGAKAGVNFAGISVSEGPEPDGRVGFHLGVLAQVNVMENLAIQPELLLSVQGGEDASITYLSVPILGKYYILDQLSVHAGLQPGVVIGKDDDLDGFLKTIDLSLPVGAEYQITDNIGAGVRYVLGLSSVSDLNDTIFRDVNWFNRVLQVYFTYNLPTSL